MAGRKVGYFSLVVAFCDFKLKGYAFIFMLFIKNVVYLLKPSDELLLDLAQLSKDLDIERTNSGGAISLSFSEITLKLTKRGYIFIFLKGDLRKSFELLTEFLQHHFQFIYDYMSNSRIKYVPSLINIQSVCYFKGGINHTFNCLKEKLDAKFVPLENGKVNISLKGEWTGILCSRGSGSCLSIICKNILLFNKCNKFFNDLMLNDGFLKI